MTDVDKEVAEDYRHQRQEATARKSGVTSKSMDEQLQWMEDNKELVLSIAKGCGASSGEEAAAVERYKRALLSTSPGSAWDDINA